MNRYGKMLGTISSFLMVFSAFAFDWTATNATGQITIPNNTLATVTDADVPTVAAITQITMGNYASKISFENNTVPLTLKAGIFSGGGAGSGSRWLAMTANSRVTFNGAISPNNDSSYLDFGTCTVNGTFNGYYKAARYGIRTGAVMEFTETAKIYSPSDTFYFDNLATDSNLYSPNGTLKFACRFPFSGNVSQVNFMRNKFELTKENAFEGIGTLSLAVGGRDGGTFLSKINLCGTNQRLQRVNVTGQNTSGFKATHYLEINSEEPATLTQSFTPGTATAVSSCMRFLGAVSYVYDAACTNVLSSVAALTGADGFKSVSTATGSLTVKQGTLVFPDGAAWQGAGDVLVKTGATLVFKGADAHTNEDSVVTIETGAKVSVASGANIAAKKFVIAGKELTTPGVYGAAELAAGGYEAVLEGGGQLKIVAPSGQFEWPEPGEQAIVPAGGTALVTDAEVDRANGVKGFTVFAGGKLVISNITAAVSCNLQVPIDGDGDIYVIDSLGVVFSADNSKRTGNFIVRNSDVTCAHQMGFGATTAPALSFQKGAQGLLQFCGAGLTCDSPITIESDSHVLTLRAADDARITLNGAFYVKGSSTYVTFCNVTFNGTFSRDGDMNSNYMVTAGSDIAFNGGATLGFTWALPYSTGTICLGRPVNYGIMRTSGGGSTLRMDATNVFKSTGWTGGSVIAGKDSTFDLNGFPQRVGQFQTGSDDRPTVSNSWISVSTPAGKPATLTYAPEFDSNPNYTFCKRLSMKATGPMGFAYDGGSYTRTVVLHPQAATGPLTVVSGTLGFDWGATWSKGTEVYLKGGTLKIGAESVTGMFNRKANMVVTDGKLDIAAGKTATVRSVKLNGAFVPAGTYTKGELSFLTGDGNLCVRQSSDHPGLVIFLR